MYTVTVKISSMGTILLDVYTGVMAKLLTFDVMKPLYSLHVTYSQYSTDSQALPIQCQNLNR